MNNTVTAVRSLDQDRQLARAAASTSDVRVALTDRLSLRLGLWLLLRGSRSIDRIHDRESHARLHANSTARASREETASREHLFRSVRA